MTELPVVSVIVTTKNEKDVIKSLLVSLSKQTYKNTELVLVDNSSTDKTREIASEFGAKIYIYGPERSAQRNYGAKNSQGEYLLFLDADMRLTPKVIESCVKKIQSDLKIAGVAIPEQSIAKTFWERVKAFERSFYNESGDPITDAARFFRRDIFSIVGGYDESITGPEDWDLPDMIQEKGYLLSRIEDKILHQERATSLYTLFRKKYYYGLHAHKYLAKHNIPIFSPKTIYFLRPLFYKNWYKLLFHPVLASGLFVMLLTQLLGGGLGYAVGKIKKL